MHFNAATYHPIQTAVHGLDARVKIILLLAYSVSLFFVHSWWGLAVLGLLGLGVGLLARLRVGAIARTLLPVGFILLVTLLANSFSFDVGSYSPSSVASGVSAGILADFEPIAIFGTFGFVPAGFARGCYYVLRIVFLLGASLVLTTTSTSTQLTAALNSFLRPLGRWGFPSHDAATVASIALRFIPVTLDELHTLRRAQAARGAKFDTGGLIARLKSWTSVLLPLFVGLFRRADNLATAMDARCYGSAEASSLDTHPFAASQILVLLCGLALCVALAVLA